MSYDDMDDLMKSPYAVEGHGYKEGEPNTRNPNNDCQPDEKRSDFNSSMGGKAKVSEITELAYREMKQEMWKDYAQPGDEVYDGGSKIVNLEEAKGRAGSGGAGGGGGH